MVLSRHELDYSASGLGKVVVSYEDNNESSGLINYGAFFD
jgi:hypothetical protein